MTGPDLRSKNFIVWTTERRHIEPFLVPLYRIHLQGPVDHDHSDMPTRLLPSFDVLVREGKLLPDG